jgi:hypothetical protein
MAYFSDVGMLLAASSGSMKPNHSLRMASKGLLLVYVTAVVGLSTASAVLLVDSGTPESFPPGDFGVRNWPPPLGGSFLAQAFSLSDPAFISTIEAFIEGESGFAMQMQLTSAIGPAATATDLIGSFSLPLPGTVQENPPTFVSTPVNVNLQPGTYFLVFSTDFNADFHGGAGMPFDAPNDIGDTFGAGDSGLDMAFPPASNFLPTGLVEDAVSDTLGVRIEGNVIPAVPDESSTPVLFLIGVFGVCGYSVWCRNGAAEARKP